MQEPATAPMGEVLTKIHYLSRHEASFDAGHHTVRFMRYATAQTLRASTTSSKTSKSNSAR
jgi:hypothetical protein